MHNAIKRRMNLFDWFLYVMCFFPIITVLVDGTPLNKILFAFWVALYLVLIFVYGVSRRTLFFLVVLLANYLIVLLITSNNLMSSSGNTNLFFYYPFTVGFTCLMIDGKDNFLACLTRNKNFILGVIRLWSIIVGISIFIPGCYYIKEGGSYYFGSFAGSIFRLGPSALFIASLTLLSMALYKRRKDFVYILIPMYCFFMGSSRTYLISGLCLFLIGWYWFVGNKTRFVLTFIPILVIVFIIAANTSIWDKILFTLDENQYGDFWFRITSSRSEFWVTDLEGWASQDWPHKIFGCGIFYTIQLTGLWAHNDFIELLCSFGLIGLIEYCLLQIVLIRQFSCRKNKVPFLITLCAVICWLFNAFFNMYYTYFCSMLSYPILLIAIQVYYKQKEDEKSSQNAQLNNIIKKCYALK